MKFIVDEMPKSKSKCRFSEWESYPPILDKPGHYICKINDNDCDLCETECQLLKEQQTIVRCKDCKFAKKSVHRSKEDEYKCILSEFEGLYDYHNKDWFCADGEKSEVE